MAKLQENDEPINVGIIGAGTFGTQIIARVCRMHGLRIAVASDVVVDWPGEALQQGGVAQEHIKLLESPSAINEAIRRREFAVATDAGALIECAVDVQIAGVEAPRGAARHTRARGRQS